MGFFRNKGSCAKAVLLWWISRLIIKYSANIHGFNWDNAKDVLVNKHKYKKDNLALSKWVDPASLVAS